VGVFVTVGDGVYVGFEISAIANEIDSVGAEI
jgi:hypothetical protein